ncbi:uncharacterized protein BKA55DRAFT_591007 [Fusarium redolens]|uniref:Transcription factor domain-containing protein n=1 Tax=Fusarium redolens TaxID=48865 RepID=A0A9P9HNC7_FUSRE|nr:uncharacterized protein BKA55DRAFT_591007 [Fusarium redolens]KAH7260710.1 hypothetical protein BKA55DRAFT_591007 [Fusarium redolens]
MTPLESTLPKLAAKGQGENDQAASAIAHRTLPPRRRNAPSSANLADLLRDQPEGFALQVLESLRQGRSPKAIMDSIGGNLSVTVNPSINAAARGTSAPTQAPLEFQLIVQYPKVYSRLPPLDAASSDLQLLGIQPLVLSVYPQDVINRTSFGVDNGIPSDPRLHYVDISRWTVVAISNQVAAEAISLYLNMNQPWWAFFDTDLFLDDLVSVKTNFCSRMLVNGLLAWATQSYAHYEPMAATLPAKFLVEALRIYDAEKGVDSLTTVAATSLMSMTWITLGKDKAGRRLQEDSARMAQRMRLYGESDVSSYNQLDLSDECVEAAVCATAWGSFKFQIYKPIPKRTPRFRIPGKAWTTAQGHGIPRTDAKYTAVCQFWLIVFDMNYPLLLRKLLLICSGPSNTRNATPKAVITASIEQLKRLVYQYRADCESSKYSIIWQSGMLYLVNYILRDLSSNESQFYFLLCMRGYQHLARYMPFVSGIVQNLIFITNRQGVPLTVNTQRLLEEPSVVSQREASESGTLPDGWKGSVEDLITTLPMLEDD